MDEFSITVSIADRPYHLRIQRKDEEIVRKAAKEINQLTKEFAEIYAYHDNQDLLAMVALNYTTAAMNVENKLSFAQTEILNKLSEIDQELTTHL